MNGEMQVTGLGRLVQDPERKTTNSGKAFSQGSLAWSSGFGDKKKSQFVSYVCWGKTSELLVQFCKKGDRIFITGDLVQNSWEQDGQKKTNHSIQINGIRFVQTAKDNQGNQNAQASQPPQAEQSFQSFGNSQSISDDDIPF